jgi:hypothetical protein
MAKKDMGYAIIDWSPKISYSQIKDSNNDYLDDPGFYIIWTGRYDKELKKYVDKKLQYIGQAYNQSIRERILQDHGKAWDKISRFRLKHPECKLFVHAGIITESSYTRENTNLFDAMEKLLIFHNQPYANTNHKEDYQGKNIVIINDGSYELLKQISCKYEQIRYLNG